MDLKIKLMLSSAVALLATDAAFAQVPSASASPTPDGSTQASDAASAPGQSSVTGAQEIVVTGVRASIQRAQELKRNASSVIEAISAEDIGKFTDTSVSYALQRVPGVQINFNYRGQDQGDNVSIRGLGGSFVQNTVNGRELLGTPGFFGGGGRNFDFSSIPPDVLGSVIVYKTPTADLVEAGLAGEIDQRTIRPLDVKRGDRDWFGSLSVAGEYADHASKVTPQVSGVAGVKLFDGTLGIDVGGVRSRERTVTKQFFTYSTQQNLSVRNEDGSISQLANINVPNGIGARRQRQNNDRDALTADIQWRPNDHLEVNADFLYTRFKLSLLQRNSEFIGPGYAGQYDGIIPGGAIAVQGADLVYVDGTKLTGGGTSYQRAGLLRETTDSKNYNFGLNAVYRTDSGIKVTADVAHELVNYTLDWFNPYLINQNSGGTDIVYDARGGGIPKIQLISGPKSDISDPASYDGGDVSLYRFQSAARNTRQSERLDIEIPVTSSLRFSTGVRASRTTTRFVNMINELHPAPVNTTGFFDGVDNPPFYPVSVPRGSIDGLCAANPGFCAASNFGKGSMEGAFPTSNAGKAGDVLKLDPSNTYRVRETKLSAYAMASYDGSIAGLDLAGNAGIRALRVKENALGFQGTVFRLGTEHTPDPNMPDQTNLVGVENSYWRFLPTGNLTLKPAPNVNVRFAVARTVSLPDYSSLSPTGTATVILPDASGGAQPSFFSGGNTKLKPTSAWSYDFTAEYYLHNGGAIIGSLFYKDVKDLVQGITTLGTVPGQGDRVFNISTQGNAQTGRAYGAEIGVNYPLTFLPGVLRGAGLQANYTYINSKARFAGVGEVPFSGTSTHNFNASLYYQHGGWDGRLAFNYRTKQLVSVFSPINRDYLKPQYSLDLSVSRKITDHIEARVNLVNLTGRDVYQYASSSGRLEDYYERARTFLAGVRVAF